MNFMLNEKVDQRDDGNKEPIHGFNRIRYTGSISREQRLRSGDGNPLHVRKVSLPMENDRSKSETDLFRFTVPSGVHTIPPSIQGRLHTM